MLPRVATTRQFAARAGTRRCQRATTLRRRIPSRQQRPSTARATGALRSLRAQMLSERSERNPGIAPIGDSSIARAEQTPRDTDAPWTKASGNVAYWTAPEAMFHTKSDAGVERRMPAANVPGAERRMSGRAARTLRESLTITNDPPKCVTMSRLEQETGHRALAVTLNMGVERHCNRRPSRPRMHEQGHHKK